MHTPNFQAKNSTKVFFRGYFVRQLDSLSPSDHVQDLIDEAAYPEERLAGKFDLDELTSKIKINTLAYVKNGLIAFKIK